MEAAIAPSTVAVRDTKNREAGHFTANYNQWLLFLTAIKSGRYEL